MLPPQEAGPAIRDLEQTRPTGTGAKPGLGGAIHAVTLSDRRSRGERAPTRPYGRRSTVWPGRECRAKMGRSVPSATSRWSGRTGMKLCSPAGAYVECDGRGHAVPPLTRMFWAVTQRAASLARNATTAAISSGRPSRPNALMASRLARNCSLLPSR